MYCKGGIVMADAQLYSAQDIENLKQKIATYRDTLTTLKSGNTIDDYIFMKSELTDFKMQVTHLEEAMGRLNDKRSIQIEEYEQQIATLSQQMGSLNQTVEELNEDLLVVRGQLTSDPIGNVNTSVDMQDLANSKQNEDEVDVIEVTLPLEEKASISSTPQPDQPPPYKYLQSLIAGANDIQEVSSSVSPIASVHQQAGKPSFPAIGSHPQQIYNGLNRNVNMKSTVHFNNMSTKQAVPTGRGDNWAPTISSQPTTKTEKEEAVVTASPEEVFHPVTAEEQVPHIVTTEEIHHIENIEREMNQETLLDIPNEMKRQQYKNKETLSLFNFFRRKP